MPPGEGGGRAVNDRSARVVRPAARRLAGEDTAGCGGREAARSVIDGSGGWPPSCRAARGGEDPRNVVPERPQGEDLIISAQLTPAGVGGTGRDMDRKGSSERGRQAPQMPA